MTSISFGLTVFYTTPLRCVTCQLRPFLLGMPMPRTLHLCTMCLKAKAKHLLKHITDWKERADPYVPFDLSVSMSGHCTLSHTPAKLNGINSHSHSLSFLPSHPPSSNDSKTGCRLTATP